MNESKTQKVNEFIKAHFIDFILFIMCAVYILYGLLTVDESGKTIQQIIIDGVAAYVFGLFISRLMAFKGVASGKGSALFKATMTEHSNVIEKITPFFEKLEPYCDKRNEQELVKEQSDILRRENLKYSEFIAGTYDNAILLSKKEIKQLTKKGKAVPSWTKEKKAAVKKARTLKIKKLSARELLCEEDKNGHATFDLGPTLSEYLTRTSFADAGIRILPAIILGYFGVSLAQGFDYAALIWTGVQVSIFLAMGAMKYLMSYMFVTDGLRNRILRKINHLYEFYNETNKEEKQNG